MDFVIEMGYNTSYISIILLTLFYERSLIERYILIENNSIIGTYLQKLIKHNFVDPVQDNTCITQEMINEIRLCSIIFGWKNSDITTMFQEYEPLNFLSFLTDLIKYKPLEIENLTNVWSNNFSSKKYYDYIECNYVGDTIQETYNKWTKNNRISNLPIFIIFKIKSIPKPMKINKKIRLFSTEHEYHEIKWVFHSLFFRNQSVYNAILSKNNNPCLFDPTSYPQFKKINDHIDIPDKNICIIYRKEITI